MTKTPLKPYYLIYDNETDQILTDSAKMNWDWTSLTLSECEDDLSEINQNAIFWDEESAKKMRDIVHESFLDNAYTEDELDFWVIEVKPVRVTQVINDWNYLGEFDPVFG